MTQTHSILSEPKLLFIQPDQPRLNIRPIKHEAFFCKMEDKLHERLNIWVKFRAGNDEIYRKMITKE